MATHKMSGSNLYKRWAGIKKRCYNVKCENYNDYGGRGILMCDEWKNSFEAFAEWALLNGYEEHLIIDRREVNGNYCPENCRWVDDNDSANNRRNNVYYDYKGERLTLPEILRINNLLHKRSVIHNRITKLGWTLEDALTDTKYTKYKTGGIKENSKVLNYKGVEYSLADLVRRLGIEDKYDTVKARLGKLKWEVEKAVEF